MIGASTRICTYRACLSHETSRLQPQIIREWTNHLKQSIELVVMKLIGIMARKTWTCSRRFSWATVTAADNTPTATRDHGSTTPPQFGNVSHRDVCQNLVQSS